MFGKGNMFGYNVAQRKNNIIIIVVNCILLTAFSLMLQYIKIPISFLPSHNSVTLALIPEILASLTFGPIAGVVVVALKLVAYYFLKHVALVTIIDNFIIDAVVVGVLGTVYVIMKQNYVGKVTYNSKQRRWVMWLVSILIAALAGFAIAYVTRMYISLPLIEKTGVTKKQILESYYCNDIRVKSILQGVLLYDCCTQFGKVIILGLISCGCYSFMSPMLKRL